MQATLHWVLLFLNIRYAGLEKLVCCVCVEMLAVVTSYEGLLAACHYSVVTIIITRVFIFHLIIIVSSTNKYKLNTALSRHWHPDTHTAVLFTFVSIHRIDMLFYLIQISRVFSPTCGVRPIGGSDSPTDNPLCFMFPSSQKPRCGGRKLLLLPRHRLPLGRAAARVTSGHQWGRHGTSPRSAFSF